MRYFVFVCTLFHLIFSNDVSYGQLPKDTLAKRYFASAKVKIEENKFSEANDFFKKIVTLQVPVPDELAYFYGYTLLHLGKYPQSKAALHKYLVLQGDTGKFSVKAKESLELLDCKETGYKDVYVVCDVCFGDSTIEIHCRSCKGRGIEICPVCKGNGVVTTSNNFGNNYHTCHRCAGEKIIRCTACDGKLKEKIICYNCNGSGRKKIRKKC
ncbi:MAG TPA: hypothetical protein VK766_02045 [Cytophagaceae bacterium]|jgi:hypothetical protein|nr:hypothetical protein [Cytophagaceae bacterium]